MTPMDRHELHIPVYWLLVGVAVMVLSPVLALVASVQINERATARAITAADRAKVDARAESLVRYCRLLGAQIDVYRDAESQVGRDAYGVWLDEYQISGCQPPRK